MSKRILFGCKRPLLQTLTISPLPLEHQNQVRPPQEGNSTEWYLMARMALDIVEKKLIPKSTQSSKSSDLGKWSLGSSWISVFNQENQVKKKWSSSSDFRNIIAMESLLKEQI